MTAVLRNLARHLIGGLIASAIGAACGSNLAADYLPGNERIVGNVVGALFGLFGLVSPRQFVVVTLTVLVGLPLAFIEFLAGEPLRDLIAREAQAK